MKNRFFKPLFILFLFIYTASFSQIGESRDRILRSYDLQKLDNMSASFKSKSESMKTEAIIYAKVNNIPEVFFDSDSVYHELQYIDANNTPIYYKTLNRGAAFTSKINRVNSGGSLGLNLNGQGMNVGIWDKDIPKADHQDLLGRLDVFDENTGISDHATHVTGTILGSGFGDINARGMAYQARGLVHNWTNDISEMTARAAQGLLVSNHSYGLESKGLALYYFGAYIQASYDVDNLTFNAPYYIPVIAAGNDRSASPKLNPTKNDRDLLTGKSTSKNAIVVAAVNELNLYNDPADVIMSNFSSWGPTDDRRIKPDISAKGVGVFSSISTSATAYATYNGTSMATPVVSGSIALIQQHYSNLNNNSFLKAATVKGIIINSALEAGPFEGPDYMFGWGLLNVEDAVKTITNSKSSSIIEELTLNNGQTYTKTITASGISPIKALISWTDRPGNINSFQTEDISFPVLVNDLDIRLEKNTDIYLPWTLANTTDLAAVKADNKVDNLEQIKINNPSGNYTLRVTHKGTLVGGSQNFSLIVSGVSQTLGLNVLQLNEIIVYSNISGDRLLIKNDGIPLDSISVFDITGKIIPVQFDSKVNSVDISHISSGIYFVKLISNENSVIKKFIKK